MAKQTEIQGKVDAGGERRLRLRDQAQMLLTRGQPEI